MTEGAVSPQPGSPAGHAFISYVHEDARRVSRLRRKLEAAGVRVWLDTADLRPGEDWSAAIRRAITDDAFVFIACFSQVAVSRSTSYQNEELTEAIGQMRRRRPGERWLIPVRLDDCQIPDFDIGPGKTLRSLQHVDLFGRRQGTAQLVADVQQLLRQQAAQHTTHPPGDHRASKRGPGKPRATRALIASAVLVAVAAVLIPVLITLDSTPRTPSAGPAVSPSSAMASTAQAVPPSPAPRTRSASTAPNAGTVRILSGGRYGFDGPAAIAVDGTQLWVGNSGGGSVTELNGSDGSLVKVLSAASYGFSGPFGIAENGIHVWVANRYGGSVTELNASDRSLLETLSDTSFGFNSPQAIAADATYVWVANSGGDSVTELNAGTGAPVRILSAASYGFSHPDAIAVDGARVWVANSGGDSVTELNAGTGAPVRILSAAGYGFSHPDAIAVDGSHVWVANYSGDSVTELNAGDGSLVKTLSAASYGFNNPDAIAVDGSHVWVANYSGDSVTEVPTA